MITAVIPLLMRMIQKMDPQLPFHYAGGGGVVVRQVYT